MGRNGAHILELRVQSKRNTLRQAATAGPGAGLPWRNCQILADNPLAGPVMRAAIPAAKSADVFWQASLIVFP
jgi:hypothetical protein